MNTEKEYNIRNGEIKVNKDNRNNRDKLHEKINKEEVTEAREIEIRDTSWLVLAGGWGKTGNFL